jgi:hypothetical protein
MKCTWCSKDYSESSIYHICDDGTTFEQRRMKKQIDFDQNRQAREYRGLTKTTSYDKIDWTESDLKMLKIAKVKP